MDDRVIFSSNRFEAHYVRWTEEELLDPVPDPPAFPEPLEDIRKRYLALTAKIDVPRDLASAHHMIRKLLAADVERQRLNERRAYSYDGPRFESAFEQRRFKVLNAIMLVCARIDAIMTIGDQWGRSLSVTIHDQYHVLCLDSAANLPEFDRYRNKPSLPGEPLILWLRNGYGSNTPLIQWSDKDGKLETRVREIAAELIVQAEEKYRSGRVSEHKRRVEAKAERIKAIQLAKAKAEQDEHDRQERLRIARIEHLLGQAGDHHKAQTIRALVASASDVHPAPAEADEWKRWALAVAADLDPVSNGSLWNRPAVREG